MSFSESTELHDHQTPIDMGDSIEEMRNQTVGTTKRITYEEYDSRSGLMYDGKPRIDSMELDETLTINLKHKNHKDHLNKCNQFDSIIRNVNETINELNNVYQQIGYSDDEISLKKSEIFTVIEETISNFATSLQREKNNIENECEWLRQQIRIILAMINDNDGEKCLGMTERGIVFNNKKLYEQGLNDDNLKMDIHIPNSPNFYASSPFNLEYDISRDSNCPIQKENDTSKISLIRLRGKLNAIFLDVIKIFMRSFKRLNELTLIYLEYSDAIGQIYSKDSNQSLITNLPTKDEAEIHREVINEFEASINHLKLTFDDSKIDNMITSNSKASDNYSFVISSPRKAILKENNTSLKNPDHNQSRKAGLLNNLQDINYKIVQIIRSLRFTKITPDSLHKIQKEIEFCEEEFKIRKEKMDETVKNTLATIGQLELNNEQLIKIQSQFNLGKQRSSEMSNDTYLDVETLKFIKSNPKHFGLNDIHMEFLGNFSNILEKIRDSKQNKWDSYFNACKSLWAKLGVSEEYVESFLASNRSLTDVSLMNFKIELKKLFAKRSEYIDNFIVDARVEIEKFWDKMYYSKEQRLLFKHYNYGVDDTTTDKEQVLNEHELELEKLKEEFNEKDHIFQLYSQLNELVQDQVFLRESSKDSSRLLSKNSCKILLNEEKIRKKINRNMPKLLESLKIEVIKYNEDHISNGKGVMTINGEDFLEKLLVIESEHSQGNGRNNRSKSPSKMRDVSRRTSPSKSGSRSPTLHNKPFLRQPANIKKSPSSPWKPQSVKRASSNSKSHVMKPYGNRITNRLTNAINLSLNNENFEGSNIIGFPSKDNTLTTQLLPLNSPLVAKDKHLGDYKPKLLSNSKLSPLGFNLNLPNRLRQDSQCSGSPQSLNFSSMTDKENSILEFSPIKLSEFSRLKENDKSESHGSFSFGGDSSTIIGDDYKQWRDEKIKQLNEIM